MKNLLLLAIVLFSSITTKSQNLVQLNNTTTCDVDAIVEFLDVNCNVISTYGPMLMLPTDVWHVADHDPNIVDAAFHIVVDPSAGGIPFPTFSTGNVCPGVLSHTDPSACTGSPVNATLTFTGSHWLLDITP